MKVCFAARHELGLGTHSATNCSGNPSPNAFSNGNQIRARVKNHEIVLFAANEGSLGNLWQ